MPTRDRHLLRAVGGNGLLRILATVLAALPSAAAMICLWFLPSLAADESAAAALLDPKPGTRSSAGGLFTHRYSIRDPSFCYASACVDIDHDGVRDLFFASRATGKLTRLSASDGTTVWSRKLDGEQQSIMAFDVTGDGQLEILYTVSGPGRLYLLNGAGTVLRHWDADDHKLGNSPVILDVDGDGGLDGFLGSRGRHLARLDMRDLSLVQRRDAWSQCGCHLSAIDVDRDGRWDLFAGEGDDFGKKGVLHRIDPHSLSSVWSFRTNDNASSADPVLVDLTGDGQVEIVKSVDNYAGDDAHDAVFAFTADGQLLWRVPGLSGEDSPNVADLNGDGELEIVGMTFGGEVYCLDARGSIRWRRDLRPELDDSAHAYMTPILCDLNGDSQLEILAITNGGYFDPSHHSPDRANGIVYALSHTGETLDQLDLGAPRYFGEAFVCDIDNDQRIELVLSGSGGLDVISLRGYGPNTEYFQRRRTYRRLNVLPWAYQDSYFVHRGARVGVVNRTDNLVLARDEHGYRGEGMFVTELLTLPPGCEFRRLKVDSEIPEGTSLSVRALDAQDRPLRAGLETDDDLRISEPLKLAFQLQTRDQRATPKLWAYSLTFEKIERGGGAK